MKKANVKPKRKSIIKERLSQYRTDLSNEKILSSNDKHNEELKKGLSDISLILSGSYRNAYNKVARRWSERSQLLQDKISYLESTLEDASKSGAMTYEELERANAHLQTLLDVGINHNRYLQRNYSNSEIISKPKESARTVYSTISNYLDRNNWDSVSPFTAHYAQKHFKSQNSRELELIELDNHIQKYVSTQIPLESLVDLDSQDPFMANIQKEKINSLEPLPSLEYSPNYNSTFKEKLYSIRNKATNLFSRIVEKARNYIQGPEAEFQ
ncbi:hypothetical protein COU54_04210 [Candidatus Pacearchaeota archaeon CG10_big_fil_rev_8_21_14_0_10_31_24]|nr:MAG: hypothetical protein COU54_04210 [Candidatus Pacearchaeota archaeon CG10_big_fil_rev_8_21_14_0_10_31_24]